LEQKIALTERQTIMFARWGFLPVDAKNSNAAYGTLAAVETRVHSQQLKLFLLYILVLPIKIHTNIPFSIFQHNS
jgi:hypothetical protein